MEVEAKADESNIANIGDGSFCLTVVKHGKNRPQCSTEKAVVVATATAETMALRIKGNARDKSDVDSGGSEKGADGLHDMKGTLAEVMATRIAAQFHRLVIEDLGQQDGLALCHQFVNELVGIHLIWQGIVGHDGLSLSQERTQTGKNRKRQFLQLCWGELSFQLFDLLSEFLLTHGQ